MDGFFWTDKGKVRPHNEDDGAVVKHPDNDLWLVMVADGMGGHRAGDVASNMAVSLLKEAFLESGHFSTPEEMEKWLIEKVELVNEEILSHASTNEECRGMGTTLVAALCTPYFTAIANIGDSRCYVADDNGFRQVTKDHSLVNELVRSGQISEEEADVHPRKNVLLQAVGTEKKISPDLHTLSPEGRTRIMLCSDGLTNKVSDSELAALNDPSSAIKTLADGWISLANDRGGEDNISIALLEYQGLFEEAGEE